MKKIVLIILTLAVQAGMAKDGVIDTSYEVNSKGWFTQITRTSITEATKVTENDSSVITKVLTIFRPLAEFPKELKELNFYPGSINNLGYGGFIRIASGEVPHSFQFFSKNYFYRYSYDNEAFKKEIEIDYIGTGLTNFILVVFFVLLISGVLISKWNILFAAALLFILIAIMKWSGIISFYNILTSFNMIMTLLVVIIIIIKSLRKPLSNSI